MKWGFFLRYLAERNKEFHTLLCCVTVIDRPCLRHINRHFMEDKKKTKGQVFTPPSIVKSMLDYCKYHGQDVLNRHIIDNSCGNGAFLCEIAERYVRSAKVKGWKNSEIKAGLEEYVHGMDNDKAVLDQCLDNLRCVTEQFGITEVAWDIHCADALTVHSYDGRMDFVVGNPPYIRVHNLNETYSRVKSFRFADAGMTDLYLVFYEIGFKMLSSTGKLCYITPCSWLNSIAATSLRWYIVRHKLLAELTDLGHFQPFDNATTYTTIALFDRLHVGNTVTFYQYDGVKSCRNMVAVLPMASVCIGGSFYLGDETGLRELKAVKEATHPRYVSVKNGFATLADKVFIGDNLPDSPITIPVVKASTGKTYKCIYPYDKRGKPLPESYVLGLPGIGEHLLRNKALLLKGRGERSDWYLYGRTQALADVWKKKLSVNSLIRNEHDLKIVEADKGTGVFGGLYITPNANIPFNEIKEIIASSDFSAYIRMLRKYKSGGYYTFSSKDLEQYINYQITKRTQSHAYQPPIPEDNTRFF